MGITKDYTRRIPPDHEKEIEQMLKTMNRYETERTLDEMLGDLFSDNVKHSSRRLTKLAPFIKLGSLILAFILFVIFATVIYDTSTNSKQTTPPTIEQKSTQETPNVFKKI